MQQVNRIAQSCTPAVPSSCARRCTCVLVLANLLEANRQYQEAAEILERLRIAGDSSTPLVLARAVSSMNWAARPRRWNGF